MLTTKFRALLEEHHRKKWFPQKYPDVYGGFIDYISEGMIQDLLDDWKKKSNPDSLFVAHYIFEIFPSIQFHDLFVENRNAYSEHLASEKVMPAYLFYYLRSLSEEQSRELWLNCKEWSGKWKTPMYDWLDAEIRWQKKFEELESLHDQVIGFQREEELRSLERSLQVSKEFFDWMLKKSTNASALPEILQHFRLKAADEIADWNDFPGVARSILSSGGIKRAPHLRKSENEEGMQLLFPVDPPRRLVLEFGKAAGVWDAVRFTFELGKAAFYAGMNPALSIESRICGDPSLPLFWGYLYSRILTRPAGLGRLIGYQAEQLAENVSLFFQFWIRYDAVLAVYRARTGTDLKTSKDLYVACFEKAFLIEPPDFLYLYDLERSNESLLRVIACRSALAAEERLRSLYGSHWFESEKCMARIREYWRHGFQSTLKEILEDLDASPDPDFLLK